MKQLKKRIRILLVLLFLSCGSAAVLSCATTPIITEAAAIKINKKKLTLVRGTTCQLKITGTRKKITWKSNKPAVVSVSSSGKITAKKVGNATVTAKIGSKKRKCKVTVKSDGIVKAYEGLLRKNADEFGIYFGCYDIDSDGTKEIILEERGGSKFDVYDYVHGKLRLMGKGDYYYFTISRNKKYLVSGCADILQIFKLVNGKMKLSHTYIYPAAAADNSAKMKKWLSAIKSTSNYKSIPTKNYSSINKAIKALHKMLQ